MDDEIIHVCNFSEFDPVFSSFFCVSIFLEGNGPFLRENLVVFPFYAFFIYLNSIFGGFSGFWFFRNFFFGSQRLKSWRIRWLRARFWMENLRFTREKRFYQKLHKKGRLWLIKSSFHWIFARKTFLSHFWRDQSSNYTKFLKNRIKCTQVIEVEKLY